jgi:ribosomal protein L21
MTLSKPPPKPSRDEEVEVEDVVMVQDGKDTFRVEVRKVRGRVVGGAVLETGVSLPVARQRIVMWRAKQGGLFRGTVK